MTEWRPIPGFETRYELSEDGQVRSISRTIERKIRGKSTKLTIEGKIITPAKSVNRKVVRYVLHDDTGYKCRSINQLLRLTYPDRPEYQPDYDKIKDLPNEEWKCVEGWPSCFMVSNKGRAKCLSHEVICKSKSGDSYNRLSPSKILRHHRSTEDSAPYINFRCNNESFSEKLSVLVASAFLSPPETSELKLCHIDGNKSNCAASNLIWK